jgi:cell division protein FtsQ
VQTALDLEPGMPLLELDVHDARRRLEALGWVEQATVSRRLPDRLVVEVKEHRPLALWLGPEGPALVAASGLPVPAERLTEHRHLPRLIGRTAPAEAPAVFRALAADPELLDRLERLERLRGERWRLYLRPGVTVELPPGDTAPAIARLLEIQRDTGVLDRAVAVVDLRVPDRIVVIPWPRVRRAEAATGGAT